MNTSKQGVLRDMNKEDANSKTVSLTVLLNSHLTSMHPNYYRSDEFMIK